jgi:hypothetical protein
VNVKSNGRRKTESPDSRNNGFSQQPQVFYTDGVVLDSVLALYVHSSNLCNGNKNIKRVIKSRKNYIKRGFTICTLIKDY